MKESEIEWKDYRKDGLLVGWLVGWLAQGWRGPDHVVMW